jgi:hypothetical protein
LDRQRPAPTVCPEPSVTAVRCCVMCRSVQGHHGTRRTAAGSPYFDPQLRLWLCSAPPHNHHARIHEALRDLGLDLLPEGADPLAYRMRVLGAHAGIFADHDVAFALADAASSRALQGLLLETADVISRGQVVSI